MRGRRGSAGGRWRAELRVKRSSRLEKNIFKRSEKGLKEESVEASKGRSPWSVKEERHGEQHTVSRAPYQADWAFM